MVLEIEEFGPTVYPELTVNGLTVLNLFPRYTFEQCEAQLAGSPGEIVSISHSLCSLTTDDDDPGIMSSDQNSWKYFKLKQNSKCLRPP